jgi:hypothetical protein
MSFTEFLWKLLATSVVVGIIGVWAALHTQSGSALQGYAYLVVGTCTLVGAVSTLTAVVLHIWQYKPRSRRRCVDQSSN